MARRAQVIVATVVLAVLASSCGDDSSGATSGAVDTADRDAVIEAWGTAVAHGDVEGLLELVAPDVRSQMSSEDAAALESIEPPTGVELKDLGFRVTSEDDGTVEVVYTGERCAPALTRSFGPTTVAGGPDSPDSSSVDEGVVVEGDVECVDLEAGSGPFSPFRFVEVDGRWYGTLPGA